MRKVRCGKMRIFFPSKKTSLLFVTYSEFESKYVLCLKIAVLEKTGRKPQCVVIKTKTNLTIVHIHF